MSNSSSLLRVFALGVVLLVVPAVQAQDANPPYIAKPIPNLVVPVGTATSKVNLKKTFGLTNVSQQVVRFSTTLGNIDVELRPDAAPATVANFLTYVNAGAYANSIFHRSVPNFVLQGGGYTYNNNAPQEISKNAPVVNEFKLSNLRGTLAMAKQPSDPNSATDQWFFNESNDNAAAAGGPALDTQNGGFTVFGDVLANGMSVVDAIAALQTVNAGSPYDQLPVQNYAAGSIITADNLIFVDSITPIDLVPAYDGAPALLGFSAKSSNPGLVVPQIIGKKVILTYAQGVTGTANITVKAKNSAKSKVKATFAVTVQ